VEWESESARLVSRKPVVMVAVAIVFPLVALP
jgi:hypothetical protein